jgi:hypothetical protein
VAQFYPALGIDSPLVIDLKDGRGHTYLVPLDGTLATNDWEAPRATHVSAWFNRNERSWVVALSDEHGHQQGGSEYVYSRQDAEDEFARQYCIAREAILAGRTIVRGYEF